MPRIVKCQVADEYVIGDGVVVGAAGSHNDVLLELEFSKLWENTVKQIVWVDALGTNPVITMLTVDTLVDGDNVYRVPIPAEAKAEAGIMTMTIKGTIVEEDVEASATVSTTARFRVLPSGWDSDAEESLDITPSQAVQIQHQFEKLNKVESAARYSIDISGVDMELDQRQMCGIVGLEVFSKTGRSCDAFRISSVGVKTEGAGPVRFVMYEVVQSEDGETCTLKPSAILGEVVMEADGIARLDFEKGFYTDLETSVIMAVSDRAMLLGYKSGGFVMHNWPTIEDADYYTGGSTSDITCPFGEKEDPVWLAHQLDLSMVNYMTIEEFARTHSERLAQAEIDIDNLEARKKIPTTFIVPKGYVLTYNGEEIVWAAPAGSDVDVDATLTLSGKAADAKAVGDRLAVAENHIADLLYQPISITAFTNSVGNVELGEVVEAVVLNWGTNKTPVALELDGEAVDATLTSKTLEGLSLTKTTTWELKATDERGAVAEKSATLSFYNGIYYGAAAAPETIDSAFILGLTDKVLSGTKNRTVSIRGGDGLYAWYAYPKRLGTSLFNIGGFDYEYTLETVPFTNQHGYEEDYYVYRSGQYAPASLSVTVNNGG